jgi:hypothetical protein
MHILLFGNQPVFAMAGIPVASNSALAVYVLLGAGIGAVASLVSKSVYRIEDLFGKLPIHWMWWPAIGAIAIGSIGYFSPHTMGVGYDNIRWLLQGSASGWAIGSLCLLKYLSWSISLGSGTSGGTLAPLFTIGGALGAVLGGFVLQYFPLTGINVATAALVGMAAMFAGASRAWLTSIVFALETTGQMNGLLPLLGGCLAAYFISFFLMKGSIMTEKIQRRGVKTPDAYEPDILQGVTVRTLMTPATTITATTTPATTTPAAAIPSTLPYCFTSDDAGLAAEMMGQYHLDSIAVRDENERGKTIGTITSRSILNFYSNHRQKEQDYQSPGRTRRMMVQGRKFIRTNKT